MYVPKCLDFLFFLYKNGHKNYFYRNQPNNHWNKFLCALKYSKKLAFPTDRIKSVFHNTISHKTVVKLKNDGKQNSSSTLLPKHHRLPSNFIPGSRLLLHAIARLKLQIGFFLLPILVDARRTRWIHRTLFQPMFKIRMGLGHGDR